MRLTTLLTAALLAIAFGAAPATAQNGKAGGGTLKADTAAIAACLKQVDDDYAKYEKLTGTQREQADEPAEASSCIGTVSGACQEKIKGDAYKELTACNNREIAVWKNNLAMAAAGYMKAANPNEQAAMKKVQASWSAYIAARCGFAALDNDDTALAAALTSACILEQTAQQALWVDTRER